MKYSVLSEVKNVWVLSNGNVIFLVSQRPDGDRDGAESGECECEDR